MNNQEQQTKLDGVASVSTAGLGLGFPPDHALKCWPGPFSEVEAGLKTAEFRKDDRGFRTGDWIALQEWHHGSKTYTGRQLAVMVTCVTTGFGIPEGYAMLSFRLKRPNAS